MLFEATVERVPPGLQLGHSVFDAPGLLGAAPATGCPSGLNDGGARHGGSSLLTVTPYSGSTGGRAGRRRRPVTVAAMASEEELQQAWIDTRKRVLDSIDAELKAVNGDSANRNVPVKSKQVLELAEAYAWLTRPDQSHIG